MFKARVSDSKLRGTLRFEAEKFFEDGLSREIHFANDADVAGVAEMRYGAARDVDGLVVLTTLVGGVLAGPRWIPAKTALRYRKKGGLVDDLRRIRGLPPHENPS